MRAAAHIVLAAVITAVLIACCAPRVYASDEPPGTEQDASCYVLGARQAWGALARFAGSPQTVVLAPRDEVKAAFYAEKPSPRGILVADDLSEQDLLNVTTAAYWGWMKADLVFGFVKSPTYAALLAVFANYCKDNQ